MTIIRNEAAPEAVRTRDGGLVSTLDQARISTMKVSTPERLATATGVAILAATTNANVLATGGWFTSHALLVAALSCGVFAGARVVGAGATGKIAAAIIIALGAGELYNGIATSERIVVERETGAAPLKDELAKHNAAIAKVSNIEKMDIASGRLDLAKQTKASANAAYEAELRTGGRCKTICNGLKDDAAKAQAEVIAALAEAQQMHQAKIEAATVEVEANPLPASATPLADRIGIPAWALDLIMAGLLSVGANGLAGTLIAFGAHGSYSEKPNNSNGAQYTPIADNGQTDFDPVHAENVVRFFRPDGGGTSIKPAPDRPKRPGPSGCLTKSEALDDLMQRLADGRTIGSQEELSSDWNRPKQTVSDWMRDWRRIGVIPAATPSGRCKATVAG